jgi:hypothetical protein
MDQLVSYPYPPALISKCTGVAKAGHAMKIRSKVTEIISVFFILASLQEKNRFHEC